MKELHSFAPSFNLRRAMCNALISDARLGTSTSYWHFWIFCDIDLKLLPGNKTQKENKTKQKPLQNFGIWNWLFDELNEIKYFEK